MAAQNQNQDSAQPSRLGMYERPERQGVSSIEIIAIALSALWVITSVVFFVLMPNGADAGFSGITAMVTMMAIFMPVAMIWVAATAARASRIMREESQRLQSAIDAIRQSYLTQQQRNATGGEPSSVAKKLEEIAETTKKTETALATFSTIRREMRSQSVPAQQTVQTLDDQGRLELGTPAEDLSPPLDTTDFIRALNFPETAEDEVGFAALRRALKDRNTAQMIQAAQDVLTLLSQDGIYMDDLRPDMARPEVWRQFAGGVRGRAVAGLGGIRDRSSLALTAGRMKQDPIFRDAAHHFLRKFDQMLAEFEQTATDADLQTLSETRTARAFMLLGRVAGTFD